MSRTLSRAVILLALCVPLATLPACESFYGFTDDQGNPIPEEVRRADAEQRLAEMQDARDRLASALSAALSQKQELQSQINDLQIQLSELEAAGADTSRIQRALGVVTGTMDTVEGKAREIAVKLDEVDEKLVALEADVEDGTLGGAAVTTVGAIETGAAIAPLAGPYGEIAALGLGALAVWLRQRGKRLKEERDRKAAANRGLIDSVDALLNSSLVAEKDSAKRVLADAQTPVARNEARRVLAGGE